MTQEQILGLVFSIGGAIGLYIAILKPEGLLASRRGKMWIKIIGVTGTRLLTGCVSLLVVIAGILGLIGVLKG